MQHMSQITFNTIQSFKLSFSHATYKPNYFQHNTKLIFFHLSCIFIFFLDFVISSFNFFTELDPSILKFWDEAL